MHQQQAAFENTVVKDEIASNEQFLLFIRPSKTGRIMGSPVAGGRPDKELDAARPPGHLIQGECSAQES